MREMYDFVAFGTLGNHFSGIGCPTSKNGVYGLKMFFPKPGAILFPECRQKLFYQCCQFHDSGSLFPVSIHDGVDSGGTILK
jgi:hypothetical protein